MTEPARPIGSHVVVWVPTLGIAVFLLVLDERAYGTVRSIDNDVALLARGHLRVPFLFARYRRLRRGRGRRIRQQVTGRVDDDRADRFADDVAQRLLRFVRVLGIEGVEVSCELRQATVREIATFAVGVLAARGRRGGEQQSDAQHRVAVMMSTQSCAAGFCDAWERCAASQLTKTVE